MIQFSDFEKKIKVIFKDKALLKQAFTHRSYINENGGTALSHNERLEFLGDAVLELIVTDFLYKKYPNYTEGELTKRKKAFDELTRLVTKEDLEAMRESSKEFRENFKLK